VDPVPEVVLADFLEVLALAQPAAESARLVEAERLADQVAGYLAARSAVRRKVLLVVRPAGLCSELAAEPLAVPCRRQREGRFVARSAGQPYFAELEWFAELRRDLAAVRFVLAVSRRVDSMLRIRMQLELT
jgi:hypothetical protein